MSLERLPALPELAPRWRGGTIEFPLHHMRGGTSTGLVIWERYAPSDRALREELLRHLMGLPLAGERQGNRQITGLGRGLPTSNKVFFADLEPDGAGGVRLVSTLAQLAADKAAIDWSVNCGNMSAALPLWALDTGLAAMHAPGLFEIEIRNTNTGVIAGSRMRLGVHGAAATAEIPGVDGAFPAVDLFLHHPAGAKTGGLLPTGRARDRVAGHDVSCVDVAVPMVIARAADFGMTATEPPAALDADRAFKAALREIWVAAGLLMRLANRDGSKMTAEQLARSETVPKVCIVGPPRGAGHISVRYFTPQAAHGSMAVTGGCCLAAAALIEGSVAHEQARGVVMPGGELSEIGVDIENPAGILAATVEARVGGEGLVVRKAAYKRSAQTLLRGHVPLYRASPALVTELEQIIEGAVELAA
jgi:2-methylaconitate cis-trans-isomerase PrpF